jgi:hypothetical protein
MTRILFSEHTISTTDSPQHTSVVNRMKRTIVVLNNIKEEQARYLGVESINKNFTSTICCQMCSLTIQPTLNSHSCQIQMCVRPTTQPTLMTTPCCQMCVRPTIQPTLMTPCCQMCVRPTIQPTLMTPCCQMCVRPTIQPTRMTLCLVQDSKMEVIKMALGHILASSFFFACTSVLRRICAR